MLRHGRGTGAAGAPFRRPSRLDRSPQAGDAARGISQILASDEDRLAQQDVARPAEGGAAAGRAGSHTLRIELSQRIQALRSEISALRSEEKSLRGDLRRTADNRSPAARKLRLRRIDLARRPGDAKGEMEALSGQFDAIRVKKRPAYSTIGSD
jgi:uncharacterized small protein (DUF1192 family)